MSYIAVASVRRALGNTASAAIPDEDISANIEYADSEIDNYLCNRYVTPLNPIPKVIANFSKILSVYYIVAEAFATGTVPVAWDTIKDQYDRVIKRLIAISEGKLSIATAVKVASTASKIRSSTEDIRKTFDLDDELNWGVDGIDLDRVADERDDRESRLSQESGDD